MSVHTGDMHNVREARARGIINTLKLEIPEMRDMSDPVIRFERTSSGIQYEVYDVADPNGQGIMHSLQLGLNTTPPSTKLSKAALPAQATWWRFI